MKKRIRLLGITGLLAVLILTSCNNPSRFKSDVETDKKPWTNLNFYNDPDNFQFVIVADRTGGNRRGIFDNAVDKVNLLMPEFVLCVGDLIPGYTRDTAQIRKEWNEVNAEIGKLKMPFFYLPGNHDITNEVMQEEWEKRYGRRYYNFVYKNTLFIILDSNDDDDHNLTREQTDFALQSLQEHPDVRWTFVLMHHPIWKYDTDGRFGEIEEAMQNRKHTVIAGHEHHYHQTERNGTNYYVLGTTGAGNRLRGNYFGEFDHITWMTMTNEGPVMANLRLDGILPHDISNDETRVLANAMLANTSMQHLVLCNPGAQFRNGTLYLSFTNRSESTLRIDLSFYHHHQLELSESEIRVELEPGTEKTVELPFKTDKPMRYADIGLLQYDWKMQYTDTEVRDFGLEGQSRIFVTPSETQFIQPGVNVFIDKTTVNYSHPFNGLSAFYSLNGNAFKAYKNPIELENTGDLEFYIKNSKGEVSKPELKTYTQSPMREPEQVSNLEPGMKYRYFEGEWDQIPDVKNLEVKATGTVVDFAVGDVALREDYWAMELTGYIKVPEDNIYLLRTRSDDAARLFVGDQLVIGEKSVINGDNAGAIALKAGYHPAKIQFLEKQGIERLRFYVKNGENEDWHFMELEDWFYTSK